jgi:hypothetical protein
MLEAGLTVTPTGFWALTSPRSAVAECRRPRRESPDPLRYLQATFRDECACLPVWRGATVAIPYPVCATCAWRFVKLLELNTEAAQFLKDVQQNAALAYGPTGGSA